MDKNNLAEQLQTILNREQALYAAAKILQEQGSHEQALADVKQKIANARAELAEIDGALQSRKKVVEADLSSARDEAVKVRQEAASAAEALKKQASETAAKVTAEAKAKADKIVADAMTQAGIKEGDTAVKVNEALVRAASARSEAARLDKEIAEKSSELGSLESRLAKAKETMAKLLRDD